MPWTCSYGCVFTDFELEMGASFTIALGPSTPLSLLRFKTLKYSMTVRLGYDTPL
jgi:hypothetical protein